MFLDGITVGNLEGTFLRFYVDITKYVKPGSTHKLALRIRALEDSAHGPPGRRSQARHGPLVRVLCRRSPTGGTGRRIWCRSASGKACGWKSTAGSKSRTRYVQTRIHWNACEEAESADVTITVDAASPISRRRKTSSSRVRSRATVSATAKSRSASSLRSSPVSMGQFVIETRIDQPRLWWPNGMGDHPIYKLELRVYDQERDLSIPWRPSSGFAKSPSRRTRMTCGRWKPRSSPTGSGPTWATRTPGSSW